MKQVVQSYRTGELRVAEVPAPGVEPGCLLVQTAASLVSVGTERMTLELSRKSLLGKARERPDLVAKVLERVARDGVIAAGKAVLQRLDQPLPLGYSCAGRVAAVGAGVSGFAVGDRVACAGAQAASHAEVNLVPQNLCARVPEGVADEDAAFVTVGAVALHGLRTAAPQLGETFAVIGLGLLGQLAAQLLKSAGCRVLGVDLDPAKVVLANQLGADAGVERSGDVAGAAASLTQGRGVDGVLICAATPSNDPIELAGELCRDRARVVVVGAVGMAVPRRPYYDKELSLLQSRSYGPGRYDPIYEERGVDYPLGYVRWTEGRNLEAFLDQLAAGRVRVQPLVTHRFPIARAEEAYALLSGGGGAGDAAAGGGGSVSATSRGGEPMGVLLTYPAGALPERSVQVRPPALGAARRVRVGLIGAGSFASGVLAPALAATPGVRLLGVASARGLTARHLAERHGFERATTDADALLADPEVEAVVIATRHHLHAAQAARALRAGKHVLVEKPPALDEAALADLLAAQRESGCVLAAGYNRRFAPLARELLAAFAGRKAPLLMVARIDAGAVPAGSWLHDPAQGGGRLLGECGHFIDLCALWAGAAPVSVFAQAAGGGDNFALSVRYGDGSVATIAYAAAGDASGSKERYEVMGDGCTAVLEDFRRLEVRRGGKRRATSKLLQDKGHRAEVAAFISAAQSGLPPVALATLAAVSRATFAAVESLRTGAPVSLDRAP
jgi:predicted dehydrogenase/threonine dehydrogenase-like Zn-dependent dehydrogenase